MYLVVDDKSIKVLSLLYEVTHCSQIVGKLQDTLDKFDVGRDYGGVGQSVTMDTV